MGLTEIIFFFGLCQSYRSGIQPKFRHLEQKLNDEQRPPPHPTKKKKEEEDYVRKINCLLYLL
jgi:hypothetical protein